MSSRNAAVTAGENAEWRSLFRTRLVLDVLTNPRKSHGHHTWCRGARPMPPWACPPGRRLGPLHRVLPGIWPYLDKTQTSEGRQKYSAMPITLSHDGILTKGFSCKWWDAVDANRGVVRV